MASDILIYENGGGGELLLRGDDFATVNGIEDTPYLAMFGGSDWIFNYLTPTEQYACKTEDALRTNPLTSAGRVAIERAILSDLSYLDDIAGTTYAVATYINQPNRLDILITINGQQFNLSWNPDTLYLAYKIL